MNPNSNIPVNPAKIQVKPVKMIPGTDIPDIPVYLMTPQQKSRYAVLQQKRLSKSTQIEPIPESKKTSPILEYKKPNKIRFNDLEEGDEDEDEEEDDDEEENDEDEEEEEEEDEDKDEDDEEDEDKEIGDEDEDYEETKKDKKKKNMDEEGVEEKNYDDFEINNGLESDNETHDDDEDDDDEDDTYLQKFNSELNKNYLIEMHPESIIHNEDEIAALTSIVRDKNNNIIDDLHRTIPYLTKYERARILGQRAKQINSGAKPFVKVPEKIIDGYLVAEIELKQRRIPFIVRRPIPGGGCEYWNLKDLEVIDFNNF